MPKPRYGRKPVPEEERYCSVYCLVKGWRKSERARIASEAEQAALVVRYCQPCGKKISKARLRQWPSSKTCTPECSFVLAKKRQLDSTARHKTRQRRRNSAEKAAALEGTALCVVDQLEIPKERRVQWSGVVTCSPRCAKEHQRALVNAGKRRRRARNGG